MSIIVVQDLFCPSSVAIVGASDDEEKIGGLLLKYLREHEYRGDIYPVNPGDDRIQGVRSYDTIEDVPTVPDVALVVVPASLVVDLVEDCLGVGITNVVIVSSGFSETGSGDGQRAETRLAELATQHEATIVGPNSQGFINVPDGIAASFSPTLQQDHLLAGTTSFVTQSGAFGGALTTKFQDHNLGLNLVVATGNESSTEALDFVEYMAHDEQTEIVAGYIEGFEDGRKLVELKRTETGIDVPIVVLKVGRSSRAKEAAKSHTGKIAGRYDIYDAIFSETGVISVESISTFVLTCMALTRLLKSETSTLPGRNVGVVTTSGGAGVHIADVAAAEGLDLPPISENARAAIGELVPSYGSTINPIDSTAQASVEERCGIAAELCDEDDIDVVLFQITNASGEYAAEYAESIAKIAGNKETPIFVCWTGGFDKAAALSLYEDANIPVFEDPSVCVKTIAAISQFVDSKKPLRESMDLPARLSPDDDTDTRPAKLTEVQAKELLREYGVKTSTERLVHSSDDAVEAANYCGFPVVAKVVSPEVDHRNEIGGVRTNLESAEAVRSAYEELEKLCRERGLEADGIVIQEYVESELELGIGLLTETEFGPVLMAGHGGTDIEETGDVTFRTIPVSRAQAAAMLDEIDVIDEGELTSAQRESVVDSIVAVSELYRDNQWISEGDVNPLLVNQTEAVAVDGLFMANE